MAIFNNDPQDDNDEEVKEKQWAVFLERVNDQTQMAGWFWEAMGPDSYHADYELGSPEEQEATAKLREALINIAETENDEAYLVFAKLFADPAIKYLTPSEEDAAEMVRNEAADEFERREAAESDYYEGIAEERRLKELREGGKYE